jgi:hypothetical protein
MLFYWDKSGKGDDRYVFLFGPTGYPVWTFAIRLQSILPSPVISRSEFSKAVSKTG